MMKKKIVWSIFALLCILIGLYPILYFFLDREFGLLSSKNAAILSDLPWNIGFYTHITLGGIALLIGWIQFSQSIRATNIGLHRTIGKVYVITVLVSALAAFFIGFSATGGPIASIGFISLSIIWFYTTLAAYVSIRQKNVQRHETMMIYSYAACFAAVTLRLWLPLLMLTFQDFTVAYRIVAWLCWVPNIIVAYGLIRFK